MKTTKRVTKTVKESRKPVGNTGNRAVREVTYTKNSIYLPHNNQNNLLTTQTSNTRFLNATTAQKVTLPMLL